MRFRLCQIKAALFGRPALTKREAFMILAVALQKQTSLLSLDLNHNQVMQLAVGPLVAHGSSLSWAISVHRYSIVNNRVKLVLKKCILLMTVHRSHTGPIRVKASV